MHSRTKIRNAVAALVANLGTTGDRVFRSRSFVLTRDQLPALSVYTTEEAVTRMTLGAPVKVQRALTLIIEGHAEKDADIEDTLDQMAAEVEVALCADLVVDGRELSTQLTETSSRLIDDGDIPLGLIRLTYLIPYSTGADTPQTVA